MAEPGFIKPLILLEWKGKNVSEALGGYVKSITWSESMDKKKAGKDQLSLVLNNTSRIFNDAWYPVKGDVIKPALQWEDGGTTRTWHWGAFQTDSIRFRFSPDDVNIGALGQPGTASKIEQQSNAVYEAVTLEQLAERVARQGGMRSEYSGPVIMIERAEQRAESARDMLSRLAALNGLAISSKSGVLYVGVPASVTQQAMLLSLTNRHTITSLDLPVESSRNGGYTSATVEYYDSQKKQSVSYTAGKQGTASEKTVSEYDAPVHSVEEARRYAENLLGGRGDKKGAEGRIGLTGQPVSTGQIIQFTDCGKLPPRWQITEQTTTVTPRGWTTEARIKKL